MRGLLGRPVHTRNSGLLGLLGAPIPADAGDEMFLRRYAERGSELPPVAALSAKADGGKTGVMSQAIPGGGPQRPRVSPWRVLDAVLGGSTITEGIDAERARLQTPQNDPMQARLLKIAEGMGPQALLAFGTNPEAFGESIGMQFRPTTTAEGSITTYGPGPDAPRVGAPVVDRFDDRYGIIDPLNPQAGAQYTDPRGPTFAEETGRINANNPINIAPGGRAIDPRTGQTIAEGAPRVFSAADGAELYDEQGNPIARNAPEPRAPSAQDVELEGQISALSTDVEPVLRDMRSLLESGDIIAGFGAEARLQAARALASAGNEQAQRQVAATERYRNLSGRLRVGMAKSLGANPSNADIQLLERVTAGDISQSPDGLLATLQDGEALARRQRDALTARRGSRGGGGQGRPRARNPQTGEVIEWDGTAWVPAR